ncbi:MAG: glycosyltransferase family 4 protein [Polyangiaceae bacterium]|nr:glycosyltransferase family 4 protein [Polyangiaceae bacterium]
MKLTRPLRVAHVATVDLTLRYQLLGELRLVRDAGHDVTLLSARGPDTTELEASGFRHLHVPFNRRLTPARDLAALARLVAHFRRERFDLVHVHTPKASLVGALAARMAGVPHVVGTAHGLRVPVAGDPATRAGWIAAERAIASLVDVLLVESREDAAAAPRLGLRPRREVRWIGGGIDLVRFSPSARAAELRAGVREELGVPPGALVVGFVGRLVEEKGVLDLVRAIGTVRQRIPGAHALIVGAPDLEKADAVRVTAGVRSGPREGCTFTGLRHDVERLHAAFDVFCLPSRREGLPRVAMEAAAMGVPSVLSDVRGCREIVDEGVEGLLVPPGDVPALAGALERLLTDAALAQRLGAAARERALRQFDERAAAARIVAVYAELAG